MLEMIASRLRKYNKDVLDPVVQLAIEIAREGREGRRIGTLFTVGDSDGFCRFLAPLSLTLWLAMPARRGW
jgi:diadenylate cyclase